MEQPIILNQIMPEWIEYKSNYIKKSTISIYSVQYYKSIAPTFGNHTATPTEDEVQQFVLDLLTIRALSLKTARDTIIILNMILRFANKKYGWDFPNYDIKYPTEFLKNRKIEVISKENQKKILQFVKDEFTFERFGIYLTLTTGMRIGEICALKWSDIDMEEGVVHISRTLQRYYIHETLRGEDARHTKIIEGAPKTSNSERVIPLCKDALKMLKPIMKFVNPNYYVINNREKPIEPRTYRVFYRELLKKLDLPYIKFHGLRHTFATRCIASGADVKTVSALLGHANIATTLNTYVHPSIEDKKKVIGQIFK